MSTTTMKQTRATSAKPRTTISKILVPVDFGDQANHALAYAEQIASQFGASLELLHVVSVPYILPVSDGGLFQLDPGAVARVVSDAEQRLANSLAAVGAPARAHTTVKTGDPRQQIVDFAKEKGVDLIVMGTRGLTGAAHLFFGSVAEHVVRTATCPVLTVR